MMHEHQLHSPQPVAQSHSSARSVRRCEALETLQAQDGGPLQCFGLLLQLSQASMQQWIYERLQKPLTGKAWGIKHQSALLILGTRAQSPESKMSACERRKIPASS